MQATYIVLWAIVPYLSIALFVVGHVWRYRRDHFAWSDERMDLFRPRAVRWGLILFHIGAFAVIAGHVLGILIPKTWLISDLGVTTSSYRLFAVSAGSAFGLAASVGLGALLYRRTLIPSIVARSRPIDVLTLGVLGTVIVLGVVQTIGIDLLGGGYDYRSTVAVWYRSLFVLDPNYQLMTTAPILYQLHAAAAWAVVAVWPFGRLVHVWYFPFWITKRFQMQRQVL